MEVVSPGYYVETMQGLLSDMRVLEQLIATNLPEIHAHMGTSCMYVCVCCTSIDRRETAWRLWWLSIFVPSCGATFT